MQITASDWQAAAHCVVFLTFKCDAKSLQWKLDGCSSILWNAHNYTAFVSKRLAICAQAVYFLHSTRPSVTWLNSRWWLAACDWVMSALSTVLSTRVGRRRKFREVFCTECTSQGSDFELIRTLKMEISNPIEGYFGSEFVAICNHCGVMAAWSRKTLQIFEKLLRFFLKNDFLR